MNAADLLNEAATTWGVGVKLHRENKLSVGRLLHEYILAAMREKSQLPSKEKASYAASRGKLIADAAERLKITVFDVNDLIRVAMAAEMLSPSGEFGDIPWVALRRFARYVRRASANKDAYEILKTNQFELRETWEKTPDFSDGKKLFDDAIEQGMSVRQITKRVRTGGRGKPRKAVVVDTDLKINIPKAIKVCSPKEAAEMLYHELMSNHDPIATAHHLMEMLKQVAKDSRRKGLVA